MNGSNSQEYFRRRADQATALAEAATIPGVRSIHRDMASRYRELAEGGEPPAPRPRLSLSF